MDSLNVDAVVNFWKYAFLILKTMFYQHTHTPPDTQETIHTLKLTCCCEETTLGIVFYFNVFNAIHVSPMKL